MDQPLWGLFRSRALLLMLAMVVAFEILVRVLLPGDPVPKGPYHSTEFRQQVELFEQTAPVDMFIIGSSVAAVNYPPVPLDARLQELGMSSFTSFNVGIRGCNYECIAEGTETHYLSQYRPARALVIVSPDDLNTANQTVVTRSRKFMAAMNKSSISRWASEQLASISYLYGFQSEVREWMTSGQWQFDPVLLGERGHLDMGSQPGRRYEIAPKIFPHSFLSQSLESLIDQLVSGGTRVALLPDFGDTEARALLPEESKRAMMALLEELAQSPDVRLLRDDETENRDEAYLDRIHLKTQPAVSNAVSVAEQLYASGWLEE